MKYHFPDHLLQYFGLECLKNFDLNQKHVETLAIAIGRQDEDNIFVEELIFPKQIGTDADVEDKGTCTFAYFCRIVLIFDMFTFKEYLANFLKCG